VFEANWGQVTSVSPLEVRFAGDTIDIPVTLNLTTYSSPATGDMVALLRLGSVDGWCVLGKVAVGAAIRPASVAGSVSVTAGAVTTP